MTGRLHAWLRQAHSDLAMATYASQGGFHAQACYHRLLAALAVARAVVGFADQQLGELDGPPTI
jgi:HEPN domain-containing protein